MAPRQGNYAKFPQAKGKKLAVKAAIQGPTLGNATPPIVPEHLGQVHGLGPQAKQFHHPQVRGAHSFGHTAELRHGHLRLSGVTKAHQLGARSKFK